MKIAMPHVGVYKDGATYSDGKPATTYDAHLEKVMLSDEALEGAREVIEDSGWEMEAFESYRDWLRAEYPTLDNTQKLWREFATWLPIWDRTSPGTAPLGWWNEKGAFLPGDVKPPEKTAAWICGSCRFVVV
jgi:hypothetical protein